MLKPDQIIFGERVLFFGSVVIIDGRGQEWPEGVNVRFACDGMRVTFPAKLKFLERAPTTTDRMH